jgi:hypothetical protein
MKKPNALRCVFARAAAPARSCLPRQLHSSSRLYQRPDDSQEGLEGQSRRLSQETGVQDGIRDNDRGISRSAAPPHFCLKCGEEGHRAANCENAAAPEEKLQRLREDLYRRRKEWRALNPRPGSAAFARQADMTTEHTDMTPQQAAVLRGLKPYSEEDKAKLKESYTPAQFAALEAGEEAVDATDLAQQATLREDPWAFEYIDDFSQIHPVIDKAVKAPKENYDPKLRYKNEDEIAEDFAKFIKDLPDEPTRLDYIKFRDNLRLTVGKEEAERNPRSSLAPEIPKGLDSLQRPGMKTDEAEVDPRMKRLMRQTGFSLEEIRRFRTKQLVMHRVVNQTRMGKIQSMYYLTVAGNGRGLLGIGEGKSTEPGDARRQAYFNAVRNVQPIPRYEDRTIFGDVRVKIGAVELELMTRPPGRSPDAKYTKQN